MDMFFAIMEVTLSKDGFVCVLNSGNFDYALAIWRVAHGKFHHLWKIIVLFAKPLHEVTKNIAVCFLVKYCRQGSPTILEMFWS